MMIQWIIIMISAFLLLNWGKSHFHPQPRLVFFATRRSWRSWRGWETWRTRPRTNASPCWSVRSRRISTSTLWRHRSTAEWCASWGGEITGAPFVTHWRNLRVDLRWISRGKYGKTLLFWCGKNEISTCGVFVEWCGSMRWRCLLTECAFQLVNIALFEKTNTVWGYSM